MKRKLLIAAGLACCVIFLMAAVPGLDGKWSGIIRTPDGNELQLIYNFKVSGDSVTGTAESPAGSVTIDQGKVSGNIFSFQIMVDGNAYPHTGIMYDDSCGVDIDFGSQKVHVTLKRVIDK